MESNYDDIEDSIGNVAEYKPRKIIAKEIDDDIYYPDDKVLEGKLRDKVSNYLDYYRDDIYFLKVHGGWFQAAGVPDIIGCCKGQFFAIELKVGSNKPTPRQEWCMSVIKKAGGKVITAWKLEHVQNFIEGMLK